MKRSSITTLVITTVIATVISLTCTHKPELSVMPGNKSTNPVDTTKTNTSDTGICFERDILPIFISNCTKSSCHDATTHAEGYVLDNYHDIVQTGILPGDAAASAIYQSMTTAEDIMPPSGALASTQTNLIKQWINAGALDSGACKSVCDTNNFAYSSGISPMIQLYCVGCHSIASGPAGNLADYYTLRTIALNGHLVGDISHLPGYDPMPKGSIQLSDCQITQVKKWIAAGTPNN